MQQKRQQFTKAAEINSRKAAQTREELKECTFKPTVCEKSTKLIYDIPEVHLKEKDFIDCFVAGEDSTRHRVSPTVGVGQYQMSKSPSDRLRSRITTLTGQHQAKQKQRRDIPTAEVEFERSKHELSFQPNLAASRRNSKFASRSPPKEATTLVDYKRTPT